MPAPTKFSGRRRRWSERSDAHEIVEMYDPDDHAVLDDRKRGALAADLFQPLRHERVGADGARRAGHHVGDRRLERKVGLEVVAQVAVSDDADQRAAVVAGGDAAEALGAHLHDRFRHAGACGDARNPLARVHDLAYIAKPRAELPTRVESAEV